MIAKESREGERGKDKQVVMSRHTKLKCKLLDLWKFELFNDPSTLRLRRHRQSESRWISKQSRAKIDATTRRQFDVMLSSFRAVFEAKICMKYFSLAFEAFGAQITIKVCSSSLIIHDKLSMSFSAVSVFFLLFGQQWYNSWQTLSLRLSYLGNDQARARR